MSADLLPPLPEPSIRYSDLMGFSRKDYAADQMRDYGVLCQKIYPHALLDISLPTPPITLDIETELKDFCVQFRQDYPDYVRYSDHEIENKIATLQFRGWCRAKRAFLEKKPASSVVTGMLTKEKLAILKEALDIADDNAVSIANDVYIQFAGYKPHRHAAVAADVAVVKQALAIIDAMIEKEER